VEAAAFGNPEKSQLLVVMENGLGKSTPVTLYRLQGRGGGGVKAAQLTTKTGDIVGGAILSEGENGDLICISKQGQTIRMKLSDIPSRGRATQGVIVMRLDGGDKVASMSVIIDDPNAIAEVEGAEEAEAALFDTEEAPVEEKKAKPKDKDDGDDKPKAKPKKK
jgi:DNA gyrase subunit A